MIDAPSPDEIGPHEGRELELMCRGEKHVALFFEVKPPDFHEFLENGFDVIEFEQSHHRNFAYHTDIFFRRSHRKWAERLKIIVQDTQSGIDASREHEIGRILGYSSHEVDAYIAHASGSL